VNRIIIDTGPIVAILSASDTYHTVCVEALKNITPPMLTTWPVLTEVQYLLRKDHRSIQGLFRALENELIMLEEISAEAIPWLQNFLQKYSDITPQLADLTGGQEG